MLKFLFPLLVFLSGQLCACRARSSVPLYVCVDGSVFLQTCWLLFGAALGCVGVRPCRWVAAQSGGKHELSARLARYAEDPILLTSQSLARGEGQSQDDDESGATEGRAKLEMLQVEGGACVHDLPRL